MSRSLQRNSPLRRLIGTAFAGSLSHESSLITWTWSCCSTNSSPSNIHAHTHAEISISCYISLLQSVFPPPSRVHELPLTTCVCMRVCAHACECFRHQVVQSASDRKCWNHSWKSKATRKTLLIHTMLLYPSASRISYYLNIENSHLFSKYYFIF